LKFNGFKVVKKSKWLPKVGFLLMALLITLGGMLPTSSGSAQAKTVTGVNHSQSTTNGDTSSKAKAAADECPPPVALVNGSFEQGPIQGTFNPDGTIIDSDTGEPFDYRNYYFNAADVPGWSTTPDAALENSEIIQLFDWDNEIGNHVRDLAHPPDGSRYAELNAEHPGILYQDVKTVPGETISWRLSHMGRDGVDTMALLIGAPTDDPNDTTPIQQISDDNQEWGTYTGTYTVPEGQTVTRFGFKAIDSAGGNPDFGNVLDNIFLGTGPCVVAEKSASPEGAVQVGDDITYNVKVTNQGGDVAGSNVFEDAIPENTEYVPGSLSITQGPGAGSLTDDQDDDAGQFDAVNNKVIVNLGDLPNTTDLPDGVTVQFKVKPLIGAAGDKVSNQANVTYQNKLTNEDESTTSNNVDTPVDFRGPRLDSSKSFTIEQKADGNTDAEHPEVGDTLRYTIQTQNVEPASQVVTNLNISDEVPEGVTYVPNTLEVDGQSVTDADDNDAGSLVGGHVSGSFGDVTDKDVHSVSFLVTVNSGQAGKDIANTATVGGDNTGNPDHPSTVVNVYPRDPKLESTKEVKDLTNPDHPTDGDVLEYTISSRNTVSEGVVNNWVISDNIPDEVDYVPGTLKVDGTAVTDDQDDDAGDVTDGTVTGHLGDVTDTDVHTVTFQAKVKIGDKQTARDIHNVATVSGDNVDEPDHPAAQIHVDPKMPKIQSTKSFTIEQKLDGNTDADHPEVGDTLRYTISTHNTVTDSLVKNMTISDMIPDGLTYVSGTLEVDGQAVTDADDDDAGSQLNGQLTGKFGDVDDTDAHTVSFLVTVNMGQAGHDIMNTATVGGDNIDTPDHPSAVAKVYPRDPKLESIKEVKDLTGDPNKTVVGDVLEYTISSRNTVSDGIVNNWTIADDLPTGLAYVPGSLQVDGQTVTDAEDNDAGDFVGGTVTGHLGDVTDTDWHTVVFHATVTTGEAQKDIQNVATVSGDNVDEPDHPQAQVHVDPKDPKLQSEKSVTLKKKMTGNQDATHPEVGDTLHYTIQTHNTVADSLVNGLMISDPLPVGVKYVPGSLTVDGKSVTDAKDQDNGQFVSGTVTGQLGDVTDMKVHTVAFDVTVESGEAGHDIQNTATVSGDNIDIPDTPQAITHVVGHPPILVSSKTAKNADGGQSYKVGDTVVYTIQTHNTVTDSLVNGLTISDPLPKGVKYVPGSLMIDGKSATDAKDKDNGQFASGTVMGQFGTVADTKVHTVTFKATITSDQAGKTINNVATVNGSNIGGPQKPGKKISVDPAPPIPGKGHANPPHPGKGPMPPLPSTGDTSNTPMVMAGILLLLGGLAGFTLTRRKKREQ